MSRFDQPADDSELDWDRRGPTVDCVRCGELVPIDAVPLPTGVLCDGCYAEALETQERLKADEARLRQRGAA